MFTGCGRIRTFRFADGECVQIPNAVEAVAGEPAIPSVVRTIAVDILRMMELDGRCLIRFLTNLKHVEIPEGIESLARSSFFDRRGILSVRFPVSLKEIGSRAFRNCIGLERVEFAGGQVQIHEDAFKNCTSLKQVETQTGPCMNLPAYRESGTQRFQSWFVRYRNRCWGISGSAGPYC